MRNKLNRIFYIYSEASTAIFFALCALAELICAVYFASIDAGLMAAISSVAAAAFGLITAANVRYIWKREGAK